MPKRKNRSSAGADDDYEGEVEEYEVEKILDKKQDRKTGRTSYKVKWVGWDKPTWEEQGNLDGCDEVLAEFEKNSSNEQAESKNANSTERSESGLTENLDTGTKSKKGRKSAGSHKTTTVTKDSVDGEMMDGEAALQVEVDEDNLPGEEEALCVLGATDSPVVAFLVSFKGGRKSLVKKEICRNRYSKILCDFLLDRIQMASPAH